MIEGRVPPHTAGQFLARVEPEGKRRDGRAEHVADDGDHAIGDQHRPEARQGEDHHRSQGQRPKRHDNHPAFGAGFIDRGADRRLRGEPKQAANHGHETGFGLGPVLLRDEEDVEIRPERAAYIGEEEIDGVERERVKASRLGRSYRESHKTPIVSVMMVRGAPTLK
jgi:hypothetical protein